jgi:hypothetical protein
VVAVEGEEEGHFADLGLVEEAVEIARKGVLEQQ